MVDLFTLLFRNITASLLHILLRCIQMACLWLWHQSSYFQMIPVATAARNGISLMFGVCLWLVYLRVKDTNSATCTLLVARTKSQHFGWWTCKWFAFTWRRNISFRFCHKSRGNCHISCAVYFVWQCSGFWACKSHGQQSNIILSNMYGKHFLIYTRCLIA